jgi:hypothetical protein
MELFARQLKLLQGVATDAGEVAQLGRNLAAQRVALLDTLRAHLDGLERSWRPRIDDLAGVAMRVPDGESELHKAEEAHAELLKRMLLTATTCAELQSDEEALANQLAGLLEHLEQLRT